MKKDFVILFEKWQDFEKWKQGKFWEALSIIEKKKANCRILVRQLWDYFADSNNVFRYFFKMQIYPVSFFMKTKDKHT